MSQWIEVSIQTTHEAADLVAEIMRAAGANTGVVIEDPVLINTLRNSGTWELCDIPEQENTEVVTITLLFFGEYFMALVKKLIKTCSTRMASNGIRKSGFCPCLSMLTLFSS